jgi:hypothetical protein
MERVLAHIFDCSNIFREEVNSESKVGELQIRKVSASAQIFLELWRVLALNAVTVYLPAWRVKALRQVIFGFPGMIDADDR